MKPQVDLGRLDDLDLTDEVFETLHRAHGATVERIVSNGHQTQWYDQDHDEWVMVLSGAARLDVGGRDVHLGPGQALTIPAHVRHRVVWTAAPTVWVAVHFPA
jgi:cupin 2 domain-containing protein